MWGGWTAIEDVDCVSARKKVWVAVEKERVAATRRYRRPLESSCKVQLA
jgi:hypothetical protein